MKRIIYFCLMLNFMLLTVLDINIKAEDKGRQFLEREVFVRVKDDNTCYVEDLFGIKIGEQGINPLYEYFPIITLYLEEEAILKVKYIEVMNPISMEDLTYRYNVNSYNDQSIIVDRDSQPGDIVYYRIAYEVEIEGVEFGDITNLQISFADVFQHFRQDFKNCNFSFRVEVPKIIPQQQVEFRESKYFSELSVRKWLEGEYYVYQSDNINLTFNYEPENRFDSTALYILGMKINTRQPTDINSFRDKLKGFLIAKILLVLSLVAFMSTFLIRIMILNSRKIKPNVKLFESLTIYEMYYLYYRPLSLRRLLYLEDQYSNLKYGHKKNRHMEKWGDCGGFSDGKGYISGVLPFFNCKQYYWWLILDGRGIQWTRWEFSQRMRKSLKKKMKVASNGWIRLLLKLTGAFAIYIMINEANTYGHIEALEALERIFPLIIVPYLILSYLPWNRLIYSFAEDMLIVDCQQFSRQLF